MADYPALYNGSDIIASMTGIPTVLVDPVDILPVGNPRSTARTPSPVWSTST